MIPTEYMEYALPMAMGLAGAALYHLAAAFLHWAFVGYAAEKGAAVRQLDDYQGHILAKIAHDRTRLNALEERMNRVEEEQAPRTATEAMIRSEKRRPHQTATGAAIQAEQERLKIKAMYENFFGYDSDPIAPLRPAASPPEGFYPSFPGATSAVGDYGPYGYAGIAPTGSGKPCPKPTKDLRPGDEVSVKAIVHMVGENEVDLAYLDAHPAATGPMRRHLVTLTYDEFDAMRTDNK